MKKLLLMTATVLILSLVMGGMAFANGGPHGGYTATTDACAGCHRAHTAVGPNLLLSTSTRELCYTCHGASGTGADTNVIDGLYTDRHAGGAGTIGNALNGGKFDPSSTTSSHDVASTVTAAWGNSDERGDNTAVSLLEGLDCASCHDPHGTLGYRLLVAGPTTAGQDYDSGSKDYTSEGWADIAINDFCATCHGAYHVTQADAGSVAQGSKDPVQYGNDTSTWAHRVGMSYSYNGNDNPETVGMDSNYLPLAGTNVVCTTCHLPHGTSAAMSGYADGAYDPVGAPGPIPSGDSALLRLDNRGVCEVCHQK
jgi:predicted CXXCH cytochrome family protein